MTALHCIYYGRGKEVYDVRGRVAHEALFNVADGSYRAPSSQQGYSPFTTLRPGGWRGRCAALPSNSSSSTPWTMGTRSLSLAEAARAVCDFYIQEATAADGVPYWDTGAPGLAKMGDWRSRPADPFNEYEPVDSSAAAIAAQGLLRLGTFLGDERYVGAGLTVASTLLDTPYLSEAPEHEGLLLHSVYHRPKGWDYVPPGRNVPCGESSMWGDYHPQSSLSS